MGIAPRALDAAIRCEHDSMTAMHALDDTATAYLDQDLAHARILSGAHRGALATVRLCEP
jgi:hypothetical protein